MPSRLKVIFGGLAFGAILAFWVAGPLMPESMGFWNRAFVWVSVMGGPILGTTMGMMDFHPPIILGWLALFVIPAHPANPHWATGLLTSIGMFFWFAAGFVAAMIGVWGG